MAILGNNAGTNIDVTFWEEDESEMTLDLFEWHNKPTADQEGSWLGLAQIRQHAPVCVVNFDTAEFSGASACCSG